MLKGRNENNVLKDVEGFRGGDPRTNISPTTGEDIEDGLLVSLLKRGSRGFEFFQEVDFLGSIGGEPQRQRTAGTGDEPMTERGVLQIKLGVALSGPRLRDVHVPVSLDERGERVDAMEQSPEDEAEGVHVGGLREGVEGRRGVQARQALRGEQHVEARGDDAGEIRDGGPQDKRGEHEGRAVVGSTTQGRMGETRARKEDQVSEGQRRAVQAQVVDVLEALKDLHGKDETLAQRKVLQSERAWGHCVVKGVGDHLEHLAVGNGHEGVDAVIGEKAAVEWLDRVMV